MSALFQPWRTVRPAGLGVAARIASTVFVQPCNCGTSAGRCACQMREGKRSKDCREPIPEWYPVVLRSAAHCANCIDLTRYSQQTITIAGISQCAYFCDCLPVA